MNLVTQVRWERDGQQSFTNPEDYKQCWPSKEGEVSPCIIMISVMVGSLLTFVSYSQSYPVRVEKPVSFYGLSEPVPRLKGVTEGSRREWMRLVSPQPLFPEFAQ
jgi:hypothetical protein